MHEGKGRSYGRGRRLVRRAVVGLVVGVLLSVASVPLGTGVRLWRESRMHIANSLPLEQGSADVTVYWTTEADGRREERVFTVAHDGKQQHHPVTLERAGVPAAVRDELRSRYAGYDVYWAGFPFTAAVGWRVWPYATGELLPGRGLPRLAGPAEGVWLVYREHPSSAMAWAVPVRPLWLGFIGNMLVYGSAAFVLLTLPGWWRRYVRRWEGKCVACGYELGGLGRCPECGLED